MNTFANAMAEFGNLKSTENGALAYSSTNSALYDLFAFGGAYRARSDEDCILLFKKALEENEHLAMKCLFYLRDIREGAGERRFFKTCFRWLCSEHPEIAKRNLIYISDFGRWDDLIYSCIDTQMEGEMLSLLAYQILTLDSSAENPSLAAKWLPSENASSTATRASAKKIREYFHMSHKEYRQLLSKLRKRIKVLERAMSLNEWSDIDFAKIPSKAGLNYKDTFLRREETKDRYTEFISSKDTKVNAETLYPYEIAKKAEDIIWTANLTDPNRVAVNKYWENQKDYFDGADCSMICVCDTSGSMVGLPMNVAVSLSIYCAERMTGPFAGSYISFSSRPQFIKVEGVDFVDKFWRIKRTNLCENTNIKAVFDLLLSIAQKESVKKEDIPKTIVIISDMEIDCMSEEGGWTEDNAATEMERIRTRWNAAGYQLPHLVYWNVDSRHNTILDSGDNVTFVSGCSPVIFQQVISGKKGIDLCLKILNSERYSCIY